LSPKDEQDTRPLPQPLHLSSLSFQVYPQYTNKRGSSNPHDGTRQTGDGMAAPSAPYSSRAQPGSVGRHGGSRAHRRRNPRGLWTPANGAPRVSRRPSVSVLPSTPCAHRSGAPSEAAHKRSPLSPASWPARPIPGGTRTEALVVLLFFTRASAQNFRAISIDLARDVAREPFFIGLEECWAVSSKIILAVRCH
jgi:hypothetical protein